jgi:hypothetical protein
MEVMSQENITIKDHLTRLFDDLKSDNKVEHEGIKESILENTKTLKEHNGRLTKGEEFRNKMVGALLLLSFMLSVMIVPVAIIIVRDTIDNNKGSKNLIRIDENGNKYIEIE